MHGINQHDHKFTSARDALLFIRGCRPADLLATLVVVVVVIVVGGGITFIRYMGLEREIM